MSRHAKKSLRISDYSRFIVSAFAIFAAAYLLFNYSSARTVELSVETQFSDESPSGLQMVPASGGTVTASYVPVTGSYVPVTGSYDPTTGSYDPTTGSYTPGTGSYTPGTGSYPTGTGSYTPGTGSYTGTYAPNSCWDGSTPNPTTGNCPACPTGYTKVGNTCVPPDGNPHFIGFATTRGFNASGHLQVQPGIVRAGDVTYVFWNVSNVRDCTVRGSNGDGAAGSITGEWNMLGSGATGMTTSPITSRTDYTLFCRALVGGTPSTITETKSVNVIPTWYQPAGQFGN